MKTLIAVATKHNELTFKNTRLFKSLALHRNHFDLQPTYENKDGLCKVYNNYLIDKNLNEYECILFVHDDVFIDSVNFIEEISILFKQGFDMVGVAGSSKMELKKPCLWHLMANKETTSGVVSHYVNNTNQYFQSIFGVSPKEVIILDGLFLAVKTKSIVKSNVRFDINLRGFYHYDLKFCLDCHFAGLRLTTAPIHVIHESHGLREFTEDYKISEDYFYNTLMKHTNR